jgi:hypothetical protein
LSWPHLLLKLQYSKFRVVTQGGQDQANVLLRNENRLDKAEAFQNRSVAIQWHKNL